MALDDDMDVSTAGRVNGGMTAENVDAPDGTIGRIGEFFRTHYRLSLTAILLLALALRLIGLFHGIEFHPDERGNIMRVMKLSLSDLNPHFFAYGSVPFYLLYLVKLLLTPLASSLVDYAGLYKVGRVMSALAGVMTVWVTWSLGRRLYNRTVGLLAGLFLSIAVLHIQYSHFYAVDILLTLFVVVVFLGLIDIMQRGNRASYVRTAVWCGVGLATKISMMPIFLPVLIAHVIRVRAEGTLFTFRGHGRFVILLLTSLVVFAMCQPFTFLDFTQFMHDVNEQGAMVRGAWQPPYAIQYEKTLPWLYPIEQMLKWSLGWPLVLAAIGGIVLMFRRLLRKQGPIAELPLLVWIILYFAITGSFSVKFLRYMLPLFPFLCIAAASLFDVAMRRRDVIVARLGRTALFITLGYQCLYAGAFMMIYTRPHPYIEASTFIYQTIPHHLTVLTEHWDDGLPVNMPDRRLRPKTIALPLYERDSKQKTAMLAESLVEGDYIVQATKRLYGSICRVPERYPDTSRYYQLLLTEKLGYQLIRSFQSYPSLCGYELVDDLADESFSVYDHPKVLVYKKVYEKSRDELISLLETPLSAEETVSYQELLQARTFDTLPWHPYDPDRSGMSLLAFYLYFVCGGFIMLPLAFRLSRVSMVAAYSLARLAVLIIPAWVAWVLAHIGFPLSPSSMVLAWSLLIIINLLLSQSLPPLMELVRRHHQAIFRRELLFVSIFLLFVIIRAFNPEIHWGEKPMDFSFLNSCYRTSTFPPPDPWFAGKPMNYYYFGYFAGAFTGRLLGIPPAILYNLYCAVIPALALLLFVELLRMLSLGRLQALAGASFIMLGSNMSAIVQHMQGKRPGFSMWWDTSRILPSPAINEYPVWSFLFADLHGHVMAVPLGVAILFLLTTFLMARRDDRTDQALLAGAGLSFFFGILGITNAWDLVPYASMMGVVLIVTGLIDGCRRSPSPRFWARVRAVFRETVLRLAFLFAVIVLSLLWTGFYYQAFNSPDTAIGFVDSGFASLKHLMLHFGQFLIVLFATVWLTADTLLPGTGRARGRSGVTSPRQRVTIFSARLSVGLVLLIVVGIVALMPKSALITGILIAVSGIVLAGHFRHDLSAVFAASLVTIGGCIIAGSEVLYVIDRMNTIFKFYYPAWLFLGLAAVLFIPRLLATSAVRFGSGGRVRLVLTGILALLIIGSVTYGTVTGISTVVSMKRIPVKRPTLDGRISLLLRQPEDYVLTRWMNRNIEGHAVIVEAQGPAYQDYSRISMHTGLPTVLGWEHHVYQRGASRSAIQEREKAIRTMYTSPDEAMIRLHLQHLKVDYIVFGPLEQKLDDGDGSASLMRLSMLAEPVFARGNAVLLSTESRHSALSGPSPIVSMPRHTDVAVDLEQQAVINDWDITRIASLPGDFRPDSECGLARGQDGRLVVTDPRGDRILELSPIGKPVRIFTSGVGMNKLSWPTFCLLDSKNNVWFSDTGNNRIVMLREDAQQGWLLERSFSADLDRPAGIALTGANELVIADYGNDRIVLVDIESASVRRPVLAVVPRPLSVVLLPRERLAVYSQSLRKIIILSLSGEKLRETELIKPPGFNAVNCFLTTFGEDRLVVGDAMNGTIALFDEELSLLRELPTNFRALASLTADGDRCIYALDSITSSVFSVCEQAAVSMFTGGQGDKPGQFNEPRDIAIDSAGNIYVADTRNHRIQKFGPDGEYLLQWGKEGDGAGQFREPMGITIAPDDHVCVADTWNQRVQVFDNAGHLIRQWSESMYGPRDIDFANNLFYVADTGNHAVKVFNMRGSLIRKIGSRGSGAGEFMQPIGLAFLNDLLYVCDSGNRRIMVLNQYGWQANILTIDAWHQDRQREPYIAILPDGSIAVTDSGDSSVILLSATGTVIGRTNRAGGQKLAHPRGITYRGKDQTLLVVDTWNHRIVKLPLNELRGESTDSPDQSSHRDQE